MGLGFVQKEKNEREKKENMYTRLPIPLQFNPRAKTTLFDPTVVNDLRDHSVL
jgi:hypothetical protein